MTQTIKTFAIQTILKMLLWVALRFIGGRPPVDDKDKMRAWSIKFFNGTALTIAKATPWEVDDKIVAVMKNVLASDSLYDTAWVAFRNGDIPTDGNIDGSEVGLFHRLRARIADYRNGPLEVTTEQEAESVAVVVMILSVIANGPFALRNIKRLIERIKQRRASNVESFEDGCVAVGDAG